MVLFSTARVLFVPYKFEVNIDMQFFQLRVTDEPREQSTILMTSMDELMLLLDGLKCNLSALEYFVGVRRLCLSEPANASTVCSAPGPRPPSLFVD
jgi:hypothetical protein